MDDQSPFDVGKSTEVSNTPVSPSGRAKKAKDGGETIEATKNISDDRSPADAGQSKEAINTPVYPSGLLKIAKVKATKSISNAKKMVMNDQDDRRKVYYYARDFEKRIGISQKYNIG
ncbi:hypothetical protein CTI12_AA350600 [Artemisia annua]|uniref:Uncharacterized protein n=1 Tax=Artemisia annua TaxID=35608 RepID=A0A2U1MR77_ARTAN|nr:hypothetical protein CTI12_AA350600 [Artemisia annua]